jgi:glycosyltransferase involved in cell wall biosynthesis
LTKSGKYDTVTSSKYIGKIMKIAFIGQKGIPVESGGVERRVEEVSIRMAHIGHEVFVYARKNYCPKKINRYKEVNLIYLPSIPTKNLSAISHTFFAVIHSLFQDYDVIHFQAPGPSTLCWIIKLFKRKTILIATFNSRDSQHQKWGIFARFYLNLGEWIISKVPDKTIVVSGILKKYVKDEFDSDSIVVHNGSAVEEISDSHEIKKWDLEEKKYFLTVNRLVRHKNIHHLIQAFQNLYVGNRIPKDFKLVITGDGAYTDEYVDYIKDLARDCENIIFTGNQTGETLAQLFHYSYSFVQPSEAEGLSNALLEAMGYGIAPIISDIPENIRPVQQNGIIFRKGSIFDLEEKMILAIRNPEAMKVMGEKAKQFVKCNYNWEINTEQTLELYKEVLRGKRKKEALSFASKFRSLF